MWVGLEVLSYSRKCETAQAWAVFVSKRNSMGLKEAGVKAF